MMKKQIIMVFAALLIGCSTVEQEEEIKLPDGHLLFLEQDRNLARKSVTKKDYEIEENARL
tara:strand:+ start:1873 stop:2055 length:183 start_codon:yes stop_codon:yes gene_type:complete